MDEVERKRAVALISGEELFRVPLAVELVELDWCVATIKTWYADERSKEAGWQVRTISARQVLAFRLRP